MHSPPGSANAGAQRPGTPDNNERSLGAAQNDLNGPTQHDPTQHEDGAAAFRGVRRREVPYFPLPRRNFMPLSSRRSEIVLTSF